MVFALGGQAALEQLEQGPFDVIVSDMRMPGIDGATLLARAQESHPGAVRIVLSGYSEVQAALRAVPVAHQFLSKPCSADELRGVIERACGLRALLCDESIRSAVGGLRSLPSAPTAYAALTDLLRDPVASAEDVARIVERDMAMCAKVLQLVNSAFFGLGRRITSVAEAVVYLGMVAVRDVVLSVEAFRAFRDDAGDPNSAAALQRHSLAVAGIASEIIRERGPAQAQDAFMAGMLHDIGKLVLATQRPLEFAEIVAAARAEGLPTHVVAERRHGATHAEVGAYLLGLWGLPYTVVEAVAHHHAPSRAGSHGLDVVVAVHVADALAHEHVGQLAPGEGSSEASPGLAVDFLEELGVADRLPAWRALAADHALGEGEQ